MSAAKKYYLLETLYSLALSFTKATFVVFFLSHRLSLFDIGLIFGTFNLTVMLAEPVTATYAELFGRKRSLLVGCALKVSAALIFFFGASMPAFIFAEVLSGIGLTFVSGCIMAWAVDALKKEREKRSLYEVFARCKQFKYMALIVGGLSGAFLGDFSIAVPWLANAFFFVVFAIVIVFTMSTEESRGNVLKRSELAKTFSGYRILLQDRCLAVLIASSFLTSFSLASIKLFWLPAVKENLHTSVSFLGWLWVGIAGANLLGTHLVGPFVKRFTYKLDGLIVFSLFSTAFLVFTIYSMGSFWTPVFYFLFEVGKPLYSTVKNDLINYQIDREGRVTILSFHSLAIKLGTALGLICMGYLSGVLGLQNAWYISAVIFFSNLFLYMIVYSWMLRVPSKRVILSVAR